MIPAMSSPVEETERRIDELLLSVEALLREGKRVEGVRTCLEGIALAPRLSESWTTFGLRMISAISHVLNDSELVARSIVAFQDSADSGVLLNDDPSRGMVHLALGRLYEARGSEGDHDRAAHHYEEALSTIDREVDCEKWASVVSGIGVAWMSKVRAYPSSQLVPGSGALEEARRAVDSAVRAYQQALTVYTEERFPDDRKSTTACIAWCERMKGALDRLR
jgi:tetratricopeptide (TPR) repeat protein